MKKIIFFLALITFQVSYSQKQFRETEKLSSLCKVWGFLKYYHPNVAKGDYNWDEQLLTILPKVEKANSKEELSKIYLDWIESLGTVKVCKSCNDVSKKEYFDKNFDLSWTQNTETFTDELAKKLKYIEINRFQGDNFYVTTTNSGNIEVKNELKYENFEFPSENYRLLSIFRYWNTIEYFFPYKYLTDENWNDVLSEMIPKFINSKNATEYHLAMLETVIKLDDSHANFYTSKIHDFFGRKYIPAYFNIIENKVTITGFYNDSLAKMNDLRIGDVIEKNEEIDVSNIIVDRRKYINGSNEETKAKNFDFFVLNGVTDSVKLRIKRGQTEIIKTVGRFDEKYFKNKTTHNQVKYKILQGNIGYVNMSYLEMKDVDQMMSELNSTKAIIIDYREFMNFTPYLIARRLIQIDKEFAKLTEPDLSYPGRFTWKKNNIISPIKNKYYEGKVIVLVNEQTQSASEYATMLIQMGDNVTTIGSQTAGADGNTNEIEFIGFKTLMTGLGVYYPDGTETQRKGVRVDIEVHPTINGIQGGEDEVLERAIEFVNTGK
jgi:carboxyl-terminal processing protease